ncbi:hypothetical protein ONE63_002587 [Megalurothrips usitatus]|uniref:DNA repair protein REV1 n=1 Tax=Megalurothrips usitatus TaxID=439358 RepID=A0AAV7XC65_9NEOP|nr:hypothetical protein ONE63_002587 [Megalurothrips usitatus]
MNKKRQRAEIGGDNGFEEWGGYMAAKKSKLHEQFLEQVKKQGQEASSSSDIFSNVSVFVNGYTVPGADEIKRIMMIHGGVYHHYFSTERTTHIIASNLPNVKIKKLKSLHVNVVKPEWITACIDANRQVDFRPFLLYSHQSTAQPSIRAFAAQELQAPQKAPSYASNNSSGKCQEESNNTKENGYELSVREESEDLFASPELQVPQKAPSCASGFQEGESSKTGNSARCASEPNFLAEFYRNSRLHHISTMGAMFKQLVSDMRQKKNYFPGIVRLKEWKQQNFKAKLNDCYDDDDEFGSSMENNFSKSDPSNMIRNPGRIIMHIDMDCFFVSVGIRKYPHLQGKPVAVTHSKGNSSTAQRNGSDRKFEFNYYKERLEAKLKHKNINGNEALQSRVSWADGIDDTDSLAEIASCSYEAREKGVKNGMFVGAALKLCPSLYTIPYDFEEYDKVAKILYSTVASYTVDIEAVSCDEMFVDCTDVLHKTNCSPIEFGSFLRKEIKEKTQCPASTGFGSNRLLARLATRKAKPDGMFHLEQSMVVEYMMSVDVKDLPGVGRTMAGQLQGMDVVTCGDLQKLSKAELCEEMGAKTGELLYNLCRGQDNRPLNFDHQRKSVSAEVNYGIRFKNQQETDLFIRQLAVEVETRLKEAHVKGCSVTLKLLVRAKDAPIETAKYMGHGVCDTLSRSSKLSRAVCDADSIADEALQMLKKLCVNPCDLRGIGIQISQLESLNNVSAGALDRFIIKNNQASTSVSTSKQPSKSPPKPVETIISPKKTVSLSRKSPAKKKVLSHKGTITIDQFMGARRKTTRQDNVAKLPAPTELDLEVLEALPDDIRNEVLEAYSSNSKTERDQLAAGSGNAPRTDCCPISPIPRIDMEISYSQVDPTFLEALPSDMRKELEADFCHRKAQKQVKKSFENGLCGTKPGPSHSLDSGVPHCLMKKSILKNFLSKPSEIKEMIRQWVLQENEPQPCDVHILEHYFCDLVHEKSIDDLHVIFKFFRR